MRAKPDPAAAKRKDWLNIRVDAAFKRRLSEIAGLGGCAVSDLGRHACEAMVAQGEKDGRLMVRLGKGILTIEL